MAETNPSCPGLVFLHLVLFWRMQKSVACSKKAQGDSKAMLLLLSPRKRTFVVRKNNKMRLNRPEIVSRACELLLAPFLSKEEDKSLLRTGGKMLSDCRNLRGTEAMDWQLTPASWGPGAR